MANTSVTLPLSDEPITRDIDSSSTITYIGKKLNPIQYSILKIDETSNPTTFRYATNANNASYTDYASAWAARASLSYV